MNRGLSGSVIQCIANHPALGQPILATLAVHVQCKYICTVYIQPIIATPAVHVQCKYICTVNIQPILTTNYTSCICTVYVYIYVHCIFNLY